MSDEAAPIGTAEHRRLAGSYFNAAWDLIDLAERTPQQDRDMLAAAMASRQHWIEAGGTAKNLIIADWQVAHAASLAGLPDLAMLFATASAEATAATDDLPVWMRASAHEGLARAHAVAGNRSAYETEAEACRALLATIEAAEDRTLVESQLASITVPD